MRIPYYKLNSNRNLKPKKCDNGIKNLIQLLFILFLSISVTFNNFAQEEDADFLDKVLEEKPTKTDSKKLVTQVKPVKANTRERKRKTPQSKKTTKVTSKSTTPVKKTESESQTNSQLNSKLNLEFWIHEELSMSPENIPGFGKEQEPEIVSPAKVVPTDKPVEEKSSEKPSEKPSKPNPIFAFFAEYKKIIFILAAIIIFAIYRLRYAGTKNYNNSGRIFSKFRNK